MQQGQQSQNKLIGDYFFIQLWTEFR